MGRHLSLRYGQVILVSGYPVLTAVNWSQHWCLQYQSFCAPKLARKWHWTLVALWCGRTGGRAVYGHVITKFSGMGRFTYPWCSAGALRAPELLYETVVQVSLKLGIILTCKTECKGLFRSRKACKHHRTTLRELANVKPRFFRLIYHPFISIAHSFEITSDN